jgi:MSHA biogenesis protein MshK
MKWLVLLLTFGLVNVKANTLQDPTKPSAGKSVSRSGQDSNTVTTATLKLTAIINNNQNKQAIINGRSFAEGQQVQGYKLVLISQNHVILDSSDGEQTLYVNNNNIKKDANNGF